MLSCISFFSHVWASLAWPGNPNTENVRSHQLPTLHLTWETCGNLWHLVESAHPHTLLQTSTVCSFFFFSLCGARSQPDWTLLRPRGLHACGHARTDTHTEVASGVGHNLEKAVVPEEFPWMACLQEQNNCSFIRSFHPASHPSMCPRKRKRWNLDSGAVVSTEQCFLGTLKHVIFDKHGGLEGKGKPGIEFPRII